MRNCIVCGERASQRCSGCGNVSYCNVAHQVSNNKIELVFTLVYQVSISTITTRMTTIIITETLPEKALADAQSLVCSLQNCEK